MMMFRAWVGCNGGACVQVRNEEGCNATHLNSIGRDSGILDTWASSLPPTLGPERRELVSREAARRASARMRATLGIGLMEPRRKWKLGLGILRGRVAEKPGTAKGCPK
jgi:hypothetical protein